MSATVLNYSTLKCCPEVVYGAASRGIRYSPAAAVAIHSRSRVSEKTVPQLLCAELLVTQASPAMALPHAKTRSA